MNIFNNQSYEFDLNSNINTFADLQICLDDICESPKNLELIKFPAYHDLNDEELLNRQFGINE